MQPQIIGIKQLHKELKEVSEKTTKGYSFIVVKNSKPVFRIEPLEKYHPKKYSLKDLKKIQFSSGKSDLSKKINHVVYGV